MSVIIIFYCINHKNIGEVTYPVHGQYYYLNNKSRVKYAKLKSFKKDKVYKYIKGFYPEKKFYSPIYDIKSDKETPDYRRTLIWKPDIIIDEKGKFHVSFHTSDISSTFIGVLEGVNSNGDLGFKTFQFEVK